MEKYIIKGGRPLAGEVRISGSKNAALPILASTLLADGCCDINNVPDLSDVRNMNELLSCLGCEIEPRQEGLRICCRKLQSDVMSYKTVNKLRASFLVMGPLLARTGKVKISLPGGCQIGSRPVDLHLKGLVAMGANITSGHGFVEACCERLQGAKIYLDFPSVGATENLIMAAALARGTTVIENAAAEPEIVNLADCINRMGGNVAGAGTDTIQIVGVQALGGCSHTVIPDRIEAGTYAFAVALTGGKARIANVIPEHMKPVTAKLTECGVHTETEDGCLLVDATVRPRAADIKTLPYPGFPTDLQAPYTALMSKAEGTSMVVETVFENRFMHVPELNRMGASIKIDGRTAVIEGAESLSGAVVQATDLRAGAALVLAGLGASGETVIENVRHIERGYSHLTEKLQGLNADIMAQ